MYCTPLYYYSHCQVYVLRLSWIGHSAPLLYGSFLQPFLLLINSLRNFKNTFINLGLLEAAPLYLLFHEPDYWNCKGVGICRARRDCTHDERFGYTLLYILLRQCFRGGSVISLGD